MLLALLLTVCWPQKHSSNNVLLVTAAEQVTMHQLVCKKPKMASCVLTPLSKAKVKHSVKRALTYYLCASGLAPLVAAPLMRGNSPGVQDFKAIALHPPLPGKQESAPHQCPQGPKGAAQPLWEQPGLSWGQKTLELQTPGNLAVLYPSYLPKYHTLFFSQPSDRLSRNHFLE